MKKNLSVLIVLCLCISSLSVSNMEAKTKISIPKTINLTVGKSKTIKVYGSYIKSKKYKSSSNQIVSVTNRGKVTAKKVGQCKITVTVKYKKTKRAKKYVTKKFRCKVTVTGKNKDLKLEQKPQNQSTASPTATAEPTATVTASSTATAEPTATAAVSPTATAEPTATAAASPTATTEPTATATAEPTATAAVSPTTTAEPTATAAASPTATAEPTATVDNSIHNPKVENNISTWDLVEYGQYPQSVYTPLDGPDNPQNNQTYVDSDGTLFLCRESTKQIANTVLNEETQKYETVYTTETNYYYYKYEPILWRVLNITDNDIFLVADRSLDYMQYNSKYEDMSWEKCSLRTWLNDKFKNIAFSEDEQMSIINTYVYSRGNPQSISTNSGNNTYDDIFVLDIYEVTKEEYGFGVDENICGNDGYGNAKSETRIATCTDYAMDGGTGYFYPGKDTDNDWWLRSPTNSTYSAATVFSFGSVNYGIKGLSGEHVDYRNAVRPATHIDISKSPLKRVGTVNSMDQYIMF